MTAIGRIYRHIGFLGLWNGLSVRILMIGTLTGFQWLLYDTFKVALGVSASLLFSFFSGNFPLVLFLCVVFLRACFSSIDFLHASASVFYGISCSSMPLESRPACYNYFVSLVRVMTMTTADLIPNTLQR